MDLKGLWDATVGEYVRWDLWPAYLSAVLVWGLTSPLRDVDVAFTLQVWRVTRMNGDLWRLSTLRFNDMIINEELRGLDGPTYAYALWNGVGLFSHGWHLCAETTVMRKVTPVALASNALDSVQRNAALRVRTEQANAERLRAPDGDPFEDYPVADGEASGNEALEGGERPHDSTEASPSDILDDFTAVEIFVADVLRGLRTLSQGPVRRGRRTPDRGDCPVPGDTSGVPDGRPLGSAPGHAEASATTAPARAYRA
ncbi:hypothetical protein L915_21956 [Phytophthora nicotianae]|uniref:Uncharacterized protein n=1 Tax=Phytophthora nicotianae TaxID=4792 RepID=W2FLA6_PHYNI|nr:hypothetical protein L915_21956 [Phytophthora nicotianae]